MVLSNPLKGTRRPGYVGLPLPGVEVRVVEAKRVAAEGEELEQSSEPHGELRIRGALLFKGYLGRPEASAHFQLLASFAVRSDVYPVVSAAPANRRPPSRLMRRDILRRATRWCALCPPAARVSSLSFTPTHAAASHFPPRAEA